MSAQIKGLLLPIWCGLYRELQPAAAAKLVAFRGPHGLGDLAALVVGGCRRFDPIQGPSHRSTWPLSLLTNGEVSQRC
jgi:hypothetical protein